MPRKSVFRDAEATHYAVLHRSLRDPLSNDPAAGDRVLSEVDRNKKGKARDDISSSLDDLDIDDTAGEAAEFGVLFDDTNYDYMQHLRSTGSSRDAVFVPAPSRSQQQRKATIAIPGESLPAVPADERDYNELVGIPQHAYGLQPDMDPRVREALEALDDEAFVDESWGHESAGGEDFFDELLQGGDGDDDGDDVWDDEPRGPYELEMQKYSLPTREGAESDTVASEVGDTLDELRPQLFKRAPRPAASHTSGFSMSSSSMYRNQGLQNLDEHFDEIEREYAESGSHSGSSDDEDGPDQHDFTLFDPTATRQDFDAALDDFLSRYEILGGKLKPVLEGQSPVDKLDTLRRELLNDNREGTVSDGLDREEKARILRMAERSATEDAKRKTGHMVPIERYEDKYDRWDCESILSTHSNLENHPRLLSARGFVQKKAPRIQLDPKTGRPILDASPALLRAQRLGRGEEDSEPPPTDVDVIPRPAKQTTTRPRHETLEERKRRKALVKEERHERRSEKKATKAIYEDERRKQQRQHARQLERASDVNVLARQGAATVTCLS